MKYILALLFVLPLCFAWSTYYVKPTPDAQCPGEPCYTLSEYAEETRLNLTSDGTFLFLPGDHNLLQNVSVENVYNLTFQGDILNASDATSRIVCSWPVSFMFQNITWLDIRSLTFTQCGSIDNAAINVNQVSSCKFSDCTFENNRNQNGAGGALGVEYSDVIIINSTFTSNFGGGLYAKMANVAVENGTFTANRPALLGGAIFVSESNVTISGDTKLASNFAHHGGGIAVVNSSFEMVGNTAIYDNVAASGAGIYALDSSLYFSKYTALSNNSADYGGGLYALRSQLSFQGSTFVTDNSAAVDGGGLFLIGDSLCHFQPSTSVGFVNNRAGRTGGAINIEDLTPLMYCTEQNNVPLQTPCFFQVPPFHQYDGHPNVTLNFFNNSAADGGGDVFGGVIDNCKIPTATTEEGFTSGEVFDILTGDTTASQSLDISSVPLQICSCENDHLNCNSLLALQRVVYPGGNLQISVLLRGQRGGAIANDVRVFSTPENQIEFERDLLIQKTDRMFTTLNLTIHSAAVNTSYIDIKVYPVEGPCPRVFVKVSLQILPCPPGFKLSDEQVCVCDEKLNRYVKTCNADTGTILRDYNDTFWVGLDDTTQELIIHPSCVYDYCKSKVISFSVNNSDEQCDHNRSGIVCGGCREGLSVVLSSFRCLQCSNNYLALLIPFALAGIVLVLLLFVLKLTVAAGTLNGIIFYANVLAASNIFSTGERNILTAFIAWLNLDLGIETCFYDGMDAYTYAWFQFVFPIYIWLLVGLLIFASHCSSKIADCLGSNPISVLATLFLLSYTKLFRAICTAVSYTDAYYRNGNDRVWFEDGNVAFLRGKHIPLFLFSILVFIVFIAPFTLILLFGSWLRKSDSRLLTWINSPKLMKSFLDAFYAPYKDSHHYWTGWLLLLRFIIFLSFVINSFGDKSFNLFMIILGSFTTLVLAWNTGGIYENWCLNLLESFFFFQLGIFAAGVYYVRAINGNLAALSYTMLSVSFVVFIGIIIFHVFLQVNETEFLKNLRTKASEYLNKHKPKNKPKGVTESYEDINVEFQSSIRRDSEDCPFRSRTVITYSELREPCMEDSCA